MLDCTREGQIRPKRIFGPESKETGVLLCHLCIVSAKTLLQAGWATYGACHVCILLLQRRSAAKVDDDCTATLASCRAGLGSVSTLLLLPADRPRPRPRLPLPPPDTLCPRPLLSPLLCATPFHNPTHAPFSGSPRPNAESRLREGMLPPPPSPSPCARAAPLAASRDSRTDQAPR